VLKDNQTGGILQKSRIDTVSALSEGEIEWTNNNSVIIPSIGVWPLPSAAVAKQ
jgi:hypothetical protein